MKKRRRLLSVRVETFAVSIALVHQHLTGGCFTEEYVEVAQMAAIEEGGKDCEDELDHDMLRQMFDEVDVDCSGTITLSELSAHQLRVDNEKRNKRREAFHQVCATFHAHSIWHVTRT